MECVELAPAVRYVARFESGSKLHALHTLRAVWCRLCRAEDRRALPSQKRARGKSRRCSRLHLLLLVPKDKRSLLVPQDDIRTILVTARCGHDLCAHTRIVINQM